MTERTLPPFPVDDVTLDAIEHAMEGAYTVDSDGTHHLTGSDMSLSELLDFLSGYDPAKSTQAVNEYDTPIPDVFEYPDPLYDRDAVLRALIAEVRRLRRSSPDRLVHAVDGRPGHPTVCGAATGPITLSAEGLTCPDCKKLVDW